MWNLWNWYVAAYNGSVAAVTGHYLPDLHEYLGGASIMPTTPHPITKESVPLTLGHEFSGVIEEVGEGVHDIKVGARVTVQPIIYDGTCGACKEGYINCCDKNGFVGLSGASIFRKRSTWLIWLAGWGGGLSEHVVVPRNAVYEIPENVSIEIAGKSHQRALRAILILECSTCGANCRRMARNKH